MQIVPFKPRTKPITVVKPTKISFPSSQKPNRPMTKLGNRALRRGKGRSPGGGPCMYMSKCTRDYARCLMNPRTGPLACMPNYPALLTRKVRVKARGSFVVPQSGLGYIVVDPTYAMANDVACAFFTSNTFVGTSVSLNPATTGVGTSGSDSDYNYNAFGGGTPGSAAAAFRVVGSQLRIRYTDTELDRGGSINALHHPQHLSLQAQTIASIKLFDETVTFDSSRAWHNLNYKPVDVGDENFASILNARTPAATDASFYMGFVIQGAGGGPTSYDYEFWTVAEIIGTAVRGKSPSLVDPTGYNAVHAVSVTSANLNAHIGDSSSKEHSLLSDVGTYLVKGVSWAWDHKDDIVKYGDEALRLVSAGLLAL